ncbi:Erythronate-4-phosphate dehydrogenase [Candidatus Providencia siddallii]|uniref:Erythronate-4-phosphate dehydrogenase n=1 Tax=Candidatus Providencia siddallii TaxID=1715285 RepID=A0A0M6WAG2_9GAMM|nr:Erythronate-4-phosphate dehydrogenase [Candidatus Providencia siddallii]
MKILVDENIPCVQKLFSKFGEIKTITGRGLQRQEIFDADALMVRSTTKVDASLLKDTKVKFVGTTTSGFDHIDKLWLDTMDIGFSYAPGCNSIAVAEYVFSSLLFVAEHNHFNLSDRTVGIVGVGNIGKCLLKKLNAFGVKTILCDPPRVLNGDIENSVSLNNLLDQADVLTFHTPLTISGEYKTYHLMNQNRLSNLRDGTILINTSRGELIDNNALLNLLRNGKKIIVVLDVWEFEPNININLLNLVDIGTPHIAGYTYEGKVRGIIQIYKAYCQFFNMSVHDVSLSSLLPVSDIGFIQFNGKLTQSQLKQLVHLIYDVHRDDTDLRLFGITKIGFDKLRKNYKGRREWSSLKVVCDIYETVILLKKLGFTAFLNKVK